MWVNTGLIAGNSAGRILQYAVSRQSAAKPMRTCKTCGESKPLTSFKTTVSEGNGRKYHRHECSACTYKRQEDWRSRNREKIREDGTRRVREWRESLSPEEFEKYRADQTEKARKRRAKLRDAVYAAYGGYVCACCGETQPLFLSVDHIQNDGYERRKAKEHGAGGLVHEWLNRQFRKTGEWPQGFQILCMNCQHGKARNGGICPHAEGSTTKRKL